MRIPAIKGKIGNTIYYTANFSFSQVAELVKKIDSELHTSNSLKEELQRSLSDNYIKIKNYILGVDEHFFGALVLAVYDGDPQWTEIRYELDDDRFYDVGILELTGTEKIFPVDGQHRVEGIKAAIVSEVELSNETIPVMLIGHSNTPEGMERSRRIFSTLNRYAKPVRLGDIIALDEDDTVAIVTRDLLESYDLFKNKKIKATNSKSIPNTDKVSFTSLMTLYSCHFELFKAFNSNISETRVKELLRFRPDDGVIEDFRNYVENFWDKIKLKFEEVNNFLLDTTDHPAEVLRSNENGGNIFFRPVSLLPFVQAVVYLNITQDISYEDILTKFSSIDRRLSSDLWDKILWNSNTNRMIMRNQAVVRLLLIYIFDENSLSEKLKTTLYDKYSVIHNISSSETMIKLEQFKL